MKVQFSRNAAKFLKRLDKEQSRWINRKIEELSANPVPSDSKTLAGYKELIFRIRIGDYRVLYEIDH